MTRTGIVIQARKGSTRLPNKMVLPFYKDLNVLDIVIDKLKKQYADTLIVLATTINSIDDELVEIAKKHNIDCYRGSENNVLSRFIEVGEKYNLEYLVRVCADNPFLDVAHIQVLIDTIETENFDYVSYKNSQGVPTIKTHLGLFTEAVTLSTLKTIPDKTNKSIYFEHVTNYVYEHDNYKLGLICLPKYFDKTENIRLTLDTQDDFDLEKMLFTKLQHYATKDLIHYIKSEPNLLTKMQEQIIQNTK